MKKIITFNGQTPATRTYGLAFDKALHAAFKGKIKMPLQEALGAAIAEINNRDFVMKNVLKHGFRTDALLAENKHSVLLEQVINALLDYASGYGDIYRATRKVKGVWHTSWSIQFHPSIYRLMEVEEKEIHFPSRKRFAKAKVQTQLKDKVGVHTDIGLLDRVYLERMKSQNVFFRLTKTEEEIRDELMKMYSEEDKLAGGGFRYRKTTRTDALVEKHMKALNALNNSMFPVTISLEPRGRAAKMQKAFKFCNLYGKSEETKSFHLGEQTIAYDARQSGYQILAMLLDNKSVANMTGVYGKTKGGDIYTDAFGEVLERVFGTKVDRVIAKRPAQMLAYMAGFKRILTAHENDELSIIDTLVPNCSEGELNDYIIKFDTELRAQPELRTIMMLRDAVRDGQSHTYAVSSWKLPGTGTYFFSRTSTNYLDFDGSGPVAQAPRWNIKGDDGKMHGMTMHTTVFREKAKSSAILAAIVHSIDAWLMKKVSIDVWNAGGKILVKHDEYIVDKEHEEVMIASYHKWLAYINEHKHKFLQEPLESCGYVINQNALCEINKEAFGKFYPQRTKEARHGLGFEYEISL